MAHHGCFRCQKGCDCVQGDVDLMNCLCCADIGDEEDDDAEDEQCPDCGAHFAEEHSLDCAYDDEDEDDIEDDENEDVEDFA